MNFGKIYDRFAQGCIAAGTLVSAWYFYSDHNPPVKQVLEGVAKTSGEAVMSGLWWPPYLLVVCGLFLLTSWVRIAAGFLKKRKGAELRLHIFDYNSSPRELSSKNIRAWYFLRNKENGKAVNCHLFLAFEKPGINGKPKINFVDMETSEYEVRESNERFAVIAFSGEVKIGTLAISVVS